MYFNITLWHRSSQDHHRLQELHFYSASPSITFAQVVLMLASCTLYAKSQIVTISQWWTPNTIHLFWPNSFLSELSPLPGRVHVPPLFSEEVRRHLKWPRLFLLLLLWMCVRDQPVWLVWPFCHLGPLRIVWECGCLRPWTVESRQHCRTWKCTNLNYDTYSENKETCSSSLGLTTQ